MGTMELRDTRITPEDRGPLLNIIAWISMVAMVLAVITRLSTKYLISRRVGWDDLLVTSAMVIGIGQTVAVSLQVTNGLGQKIAGLTASQIIAFQKAGYAAELLYLPALCCAKLSSLTFFIYLTPDKKHLQAIYAIQALVVLWTVTAMLGAVFQCRLPQTWAFTSDNCFDQGAFWNVIGAFDIVTDIAVIILPFYIIHNLQMARSQKAVVVGAFASRILVIPATIYRLIFLSQALHTPDPTFDYYGFFLCTQLEMNLSIFTACVPYLKPFMESLQGGMLSVELVPHTTSGARTAHDKGSYGMSHRTAKSKETSAADDLAIRTAQPSLRPDEFEIETTVTSACYPERGEDAGSHSSAGSDRMIIKQTKEWKVDYRDNWNAPAP